MADLHIPPRAWEAADAAVDAALETAPDVAPAHLAADAIIVAAPIIVAAELRRLARSDLFAETPRWARAVLLDRAAELDPEGGHG
jgi:hypothetical protein